MRQKIETSVKKLVQEIDRLKHKNPYYVLGAGKLGYSILYAKYGKYTGDQTYIDKALEEFENIYLNLSDGVSEDETGIITGNGGIAWVFQYLVNQKLLEYDDDFFQFFDNLFIEKCNSIKKDKNYDLFYGLLSYGNYFLQRTKYNNANKKYLTEITTLLKSCRDEQGIVWNDEFGYNKNEINLGMAHGLPSQVVFLCKSFEYTQNNHDLIFAKHTLDFILRFKGKKGGISYFPYVVNKNNLNIDPSDYKSRLAWCYGDLGIAYALLYYWSVSGESFYKNEAIEILKHNATKKIEDKYTGISDKCFCHGTSGVFYMFHKISTFFGLTEFTETSEYWLNETLKNADNLNSFKTLAYKNGKGIYVIDLGLIEGYVGIALSLLGFLDSNANEWEEIFML